MTTEAASDASSPFDVRVLQAYLERSVAGFNGALRVSRFSGGQSNPTFLLSAGEMKYVLRKKPDGPLLPSAHAIEREYRVMSALRGGGVPTPPMLALCEESSLIGAPFYVMAHVEGRIFWDPTLPGLQRTERTAIYDDMNGVIATLHGLDFNASGSRTSAGRGIISSGKSRVGASSISPRRRSRSRRCCASSTGCRGDCRRRARRRWSTAICGWTI